MTDEELKSIKDELSKLTPWPWHSIRGRQGDTQVINGKEVRAWERWDVFSGEPINPEDAGSVNDLIKTLRASKNKQVAHFHPETPQLFERNMNYQVDMAFIQKAPETIRMLLDEIQKLKTELGKTNAI